MFNNVNLPSEIDGFPLKRWCVLACWNLALDTYLWYAKTLNKSYKKIHKISSWISDIFTLFLRRFWAYLLGHNTNPKFSSTGKLVYTSHFVWWPWLAFTSRGWPWLVLTGRAWQMLAVAGCGWPRLGVAGRDGLSLAVASRSWPRQAVAVCGWSWLVISGRAWLLLCVARRSSPWRPWMAEAWRGWPWLAIAGRDWPWLDVSGRCCMAVGGHGWLCQQHGPLYSSQA